MSAAVAATMSPRASQLLGAMRRNFELLVELEKADPAGVAIIVQALVEHLRSWKPMAATSIPGPLDTGPIARVDLVADATTEIKRDICADGKYRLSWEGGHLVIVVSDADDHAVGVMTFEMGAMLRDDVDRMLVGGG